MSHLPSAPPPLLLSHPNYLTTRRTPPLPSELLDLIFLQIQLDPRVLIATINSLTGAYLERWDSPAGNSIKHLAACCLVSKSWRDPARHRLYNTVSFKLRKPGDSRGVVENAVMSEVLRENKHLRGFVKRLSVVYNEWVNAAHADVVGRILFGLAESVLKSCEKVNGISVVNCPDGSGMERMFNMLESLREGQLRTLVLSSNPETGRFQLGSSAVDLLLQQRNLVNLDLEGIVLPFTIPPLPSTLPKFQNLFLTRCESSTHSLFKIFTSNSSSSLKHLSLATSCPTFPLSPIWLSSYINLTHLTLRISFPVPPPMFQHEICSIPVQVFSDLHDSSLTHLDIDFTGPSITSTSFITSLLTQLPPTLLNLSVRVPLISSIVPFLQSNQCPKLKGLQVKYDEMVHNVGFRVWKSWSEESMKEVVEEAERKGVKLVFRRTGMENGRKMVFDGF